MREELMHNAGALHGGSLWRDNLNAAVNADKGINYRYDQKW